MASSGVYLALADAILILHFLVVVFIIGGFALILVGRARGWQWVRSRWFRGIHMLLMIVIVLQAWAGKLCPLTTLENALRERGGASPYTETFVQHWLHRALFFDAPLWVFAAAYTVFGAMVVAVWLGDRRGR